jgi:hypothetical protein
LPGGGHKQLEYGYADQTAVQKGLYKRIVLPGFHSPAGREPQLAWGVWLPSSTCQEGLSRRIVLPGFRFPAGRELQACVWFRR